MNNWPDQAVSNYPLQMQYTPHPEPPFFKQVPYDCIIEKATVPLPYQNPDKQKISELIKRSDQKAANWLKDLETGDMYYWPASWLQHADMAKTLCIKDYDKGIVVEES